jgi:membrane fusion protein, heavy metal efflux system
LISAEAQIYPKSRVTRFCLDSVIGLCLVASLLLALMGCKPKQVQGAPVRQGNPNEVEVTPAIAANLTIGKPEMTEVKGNLQVAAHVETDARRIAHVGSPVAGRILKLLAFEGQHVETGTVLATLHSTNLSDTQLALIKAVSQQSLATAAEKRAEQLVAADVIGRAELERRRGEMLQADTEVASFRTQLRGLGMTEAQINALESTRKLSADYPIVAPRSGTLLKREITIGQVVQPADLAFTIADLSTVWMIANVPEEDAGQVRNGMEVEVRIPALPREHIKGHLAFVSPMVDPETRTVEVRMDIANPAGLLKPNELASMTFTGRSERKLTIPAAAVVREENKDYVFVDQGNRKLLLHEVTLGEEENDRRTVLNGLSDSDRIVTDDAFHLNNRRKQNAIRGGE